MQRFDVSAVLLDIEGTVAPLSFVHEVLFPYARARLDSFLNARGSEPSVIAAIELIRQTTGASQEDIKPAILRLMDADSKTTGLKQLQGLIWDEAYRRGELASPLFDDVPAALKAWRSAGKTIAIYSSGSVAAQRVFFSFTSAGDLTGLLSGYFDTTTGPKRDADSYRKIAAAINLLPVRVLFLTDVAEEANAARAAGCAAAILIRPGNAPLTASTDAPTIQSFADLALPA